jgi:heme-degrading monooxygenase HmoA
MMIVRVWKGYGSADGVRRYCDEHFRPTIVPQLEALDGFVRATVMVRARAEDSELVVATVWESLEAVKGFAGEEYERAIVEPIVHELLEHFEDHVTHYTVNVATLAR